MTKSNGSNLLLKLGTGFLVYKLYSLLRNERRRISFGGKVVLISGASRGLGLVLAKQLAKEGALLSLIARDETELQEAKRIIQNAYPNASVLINKCDSTNRHEVDDAVLMTMHIYGRLDAVINNAGVIAVSPYENTTPDDFQKSLEVHFWAAYNIIESALPFLKRSSKSRIINISSVGGKIPVPHLSSYCTGKYALMGYSKTLRAELLKDDVYVTTVSPGLMRTGSQDHAEFKGQIKKEFSWFSIAGSLPLLTISAEKAASKILRASELGLAEATLSLPAQFATKIDALSPELFADVMALTSSLLPEANDNDKPVKGQDAHSFIAPSPLTTLSNQAAERNNERSL